MSKGQKNFEGDIHTEFVSRFVGKKCLVRLSSGHMVTCTLKDISPSEFLIEEGTQNGKPIEKVLFRGSVAMIEPR
jgi:small nuclear ribonucleoprotein (snRNP)-like protein